MLLKRLKGQIKPTLIRWELILNSAFLLLKCVCVCVQSTTMHRHVGSIQPQGSHLNEGTLKRSQPGRHPVPVTFAVRGVSCTLTPHTKASPIRKQTERGSLFQISLSSPPRLTHESAWRDGRKPRSCLWPLTDVRGPNTQAYGQTRTVTKFRYLLALTDLSWQLSGILC